MLIIRVKNGNITRALKQFKRKFRDTQKMKELRERQYFTKPSLKRRREMDEAIRRSKKQQNDE